MVDGVPEAELLIKSALLPVSSVRGLFCGRSPTVCAQRMPHILTSEIFARTPENVGVFIGKSIGSSRLEGSLKRRRTTI